MTLEALAAIVGGLRAGRTVSLLVIPSESETLAEAVRDRRARVGAAVAAAARLGATMTRFSDRVERATGSATITFVPETSAHGG